MLYQALQVICGSWRRPDLEAEACLALSSDVVGSRGYTRESRRELEAMWLPGCQPRDSDVIRLGKGLGTNVFKSSPDVLEEGFTWKQV